MARDDRQGFISERIRPVIATANAVAAAGGGPALPREFRWRDGTLAIAVVRRAWTETGACTHGSSETYIRKHWFDVETDSGRHARIYFERQPRSRNRTARWWLFSIDETGGQTP